MKGMSILGRNVHTRKRQCAPTDVSILDSVKTGWCTQAVLVYTNPFSTLCGLVHIDGSVLIEHVRDLRIRSSFRYHKHK